MSDQTPEHPWGEPKAGESGTAWRDRERRERKAREGEGRMDGRTYQASEFAESAALNEAQQERARRELAAETPYDRDRRLARERFQADLDRFNTARAAREQAARDTEAAKLAEETKAARTAWAAKEKAEEDERIRKWHRDSMSVKPGKV